MPLGPPVKFDFGDTAMETEAVPSSDAPPSTEAGERMDMDMGEGFFEGRDVDVDMPAVRMAQIHNLMESSIISLSFRRL